ncbi:MAG: aldehyde oxidase and xanthine dehydrogenase, molybdopterin binding, partial [Labilithrix sp.]|nr:aldehyde oxidase and xanthine dehydrogenase, molybdopterin binding [Labilithrix sp.]
MSDPVVGKGIDRVDARQKVTGKATYSCDVAVANVAHAVIVGASIGRGAVKTVDVEPARQVSGVLAVLTPENALRLRGARLAPTSLQDRALQALQDEEVRYDGQPVALVVAETLEQARQAAGLLAPAYQRVKPVIELEDELHTAYAPEVTARGPTDTRHGDFDAAFAKAVVKVDQTYTMAPQNHNPMEPHATIAVWHGDDKVTLYDSTQGGFIVREKIARLFGIPIANVRVISHFLGGGFGGKGSPWSHVPLCVMAAKVVKRPVKLVITRQQMFQFVGHRPRTIQRVALGADRSGKLVALRHDSISWTSRFDEFVEPAATWARPVYACDDVTTTHRLVRLDVATPTFMRAPGAASGSFAVETAMDELAWALKMDPLDLRLVNYAQIDPDAKKPFSSKELRACYKQAAERFGWARRSRTPRATRDGAWLVGMGMATARYPAYQRSSSARARIRADGTAVVQAGTHDLGTGTYTIMAQIAADALGMGIHKVRFELGDTTLPEAPLSAGSQTAASVGSAVKLAATAARADLIRAAVADVRSPLHGAAPSEIDAADGVLFLTTDPTRREAFSSIVARAGGEEITAQIDATERSDRKDFSCQSFGAQFCEVRVDERTGEVRVSRVVGAFAGGK